MAIQIRGDSVITMGPGDWIIDDSVISGYLFGAKMRITKVSKTRVYYKRWERHKKAFSDREDFMLASSIFYVCSTEQEVDAISELAAQHKARITAAQDQTMADLYKLQEKSNGIA